MTLRIKHGFLLSAAFVFALFAGTAGAEEADEEAASEENEDVEELVVTGSYIRRDNFDLPSPKNVMDAVDLSLAATSDLGDVVFDQTFHIGVNANSAPSEFHGADDQNFQQGAETWANLRGLGTRATMTMMDGHRVPASVTGIGSSTRRAGSDLNNLYPGIAVGRIETILDGASALYGASAVSGVINLVPKKDFDGLQINYEYSSPLEDGAPEKRMGLLAGAQSERTSVIFALEIRDVDRMKQTDRPDYVISSANWTGQYLHPYQERPWAHPGEYLIPTRDNSGVLQNNPTSADWYRLPDSERWGWGNTGGWLTERYSDTRGGNTAGGIPAGDVAGAWFSPLANRDDGLVPIHFMGSGHGGRGAWRGPVLSDSTTSFADGGLWTAFREDPGCGFSFAGGKSFTPFRPPLSASDPRRAEIMAVDEELGGNMLVTTAGWNRSAENLGYTDNRFQGNYLNGFMVGELGGWSAWAGQEGSPAGEPQDCRQAIGDTVDIREERDQEAGMAYFEHAFNDYVKVKGELVVSRLDYNTRQHSVRLDDWDSRASNGPATAMVVGSNPGNPYRAFADGSSVCDYNADTPGCDSWNTHWAAHGQWIDDNLAADYGTAADALKARGLNADSYLNYLDVNGNGVYDYLQEAGEMLLFAHDSNGDGIPDRDVDGDGLPDLSATRDPMHRVLLHNAGGDADGDGIPDQFDPDAGGVRLFEDVRVWHDNNITPKQPRNNNIPWLNDDMTWKDRTQTANLRLRLGTEIQIPDTDWIVDVDWIWQESRRTDDRMEAVWPTTIAALRCQAGPFADQCWNPFSTAWINSTEDGQLIPEWRPADAPEVNTEEESRFAGIHLSRHERVVGLNLIDAVVSNSSFFDLPYNDQPVGIAAGIHWRVESEQFIPDTMGALGLGIGSADFDPWSGNTSINYQKTEEETNAAFVELSIPLLDSDRFGQIEAQVAARYAEMEVRNVLGGGTADFDTVIPKVAIRYQPVDWLALRASLTEGFVLPGPVQLFNQAIAQGGSYTNSVQDLGDYLCDQMPELSACASAGTGGLINGVLTPDSMAPALSAEESDLWNVGASLQFLGGDLNFDFDYTTVDFNGRVDRITAGANLSAAGIDFRPFALARCPGTNLDFDNEQRMDTTQIPEYLENTDASELACRRAAAIEWVTNHETGLAGSNIGRGGEDGLELETVDSPWGNQGEQTTTSLIYGARYRFDADTIPYLGDIIGEYGSFQASLSATQMLEMSIIRFTEDSGHSYGGIRVDGVGNRNNGVHYVRALNELYWSLPATPEWRVNANLRWFYGDHIAQFGVRWHSKLQDVMASWDEVSAAGNDLTGIWVNGQRDQSQLREDQVCVDQDRNPWCGIDAKAYFDASYTYTKPDIFGLGFVSLNLAMRNLFDANPRPMPSGVGYDTYVDNIMGRIGFMRLTVGF
jgi:outer membrane receptor protein involved in Fe transport